ncbi:MAG: hypothetical protein AB2L18_08615 [Anaerolineaceae bacterium]
MRYAKTPQEISAQMDRASQIERVFPLEKENTRCVAALDRTVLLA